ncbi:MAG TPA: hypothetical protein VKT77_16535, partial [Chthonomonadaceae bacterium]|nr:hypothetical protein [Chthonomonadaceae bacterium]
MNGASAIRLRGTIQAGGAFGRRGLRRCVWAAALAVLGVFAGQPAWAQAPELGGVLPGGGPRGAATPIRIDGKNLQGARLFVGGRGVHLASVKPSADGQSLTADVLADPDAALGPHDLRIATPKGVTGGAR